MWAKLKQLLWQDRGVWITAPGVAGLVILLRLTGVLQAWEWTVFDQYMRWRPPESRDDRIAIVGITETDLHTLRQPLISDRVYARLLQNLKARQPRAIGLDIYRDLPVEPGHQELRRVFESTPNLVGIQKVGGKRGTETVAPPPVLKDKGQVGANDVLNDADNTVRRGMVYLQTPDGETVFSFSLHLALHYLEREGIEPVPIPETPNWRLGKAIFAPFEANDGGYVGADDRGFQLLLNYRGARDQFEIVSLMDVLEDRVPADWGRDRLILIGNVSESGKDLFFTPYSGGLLDLPEPMAGITIHAHLTSQIISAALDGRPLFRSWPEPMDWLWILFWSGVGATLRWKLRYLGGVRVISLRRSASLLLAVGILLGSTYVAFLGGLWLPVVPPSLALVGSVVAIITYVARSAGNIRKIFGRYLNDEVVAHVLENPQGLKLGGERRKVTILTSDLRGFTAISERLPPEEVVKILNFYLETMADVIMSHQGTIDDFLGDGIAVLFGAPTARSDDAKRAVACAVAMQAAMGAVNQTMKQWGYPPLEMGIGINTGEVVLGNIGSEKRAKYSAIGSQVNLAYRIEPYTIGGQILISESTLQEAGSTIVKINGHKLVQPKGVKQAITIYDVGGVAGEYNLFLQQEEQIFFRLPAPVPLQYSVLEGKQVGEQVWQGYLIELSDRGALVQCDASTNTAAPTALANIKLNVCTSDDPVNFSEDIYAKVSDKQADSGHWYVYFTAKPPEVAVWLQTLYALMQAIAKVHEGDRALIG